MLVHVGGHEPKSYNCNWMHGLGDKQDLTRNGGTPIAANGCWSWRHVGVYLSAWLRGQSTATHMCVFHQELI